MANRMAFRAFSTESVNSEYTTRVGPASSGWAGSSGVPVKLRGKGTPASFTSVGATSIKLHGSRRGPPEPSMAGPRMISGTLVSSSYWVWPCHAPPWSPNSSPWSLVRTRRVWSHNPIASSSDVMHPICASRKATLRSYRRVKSSSTVAESIRAGSASCSDSGPPSSSAAGDGSQVHGVASAGPSSVVADARRASPTGPR